MVSFTTMAILTLVTLVIPVLGDEYELAAHCASRVITTIGENPHAEVTTIMNAMKSIERCNLANPTDNQKVAFRRVVDKVKVVLHAAGYLLTTSVAPTGPVIGNEDTLAYQCSFVTVGDIGLTPNADVDRLVLKMKRIGNCDIPNPTQRQLAAFQNVVGKLEAVLAQAGYLAVQ